MPIHLLILIHSTNQIRYLIQNSNHFPNLIHWKIQSHFLSWKYHRLKNHSPLTKNLNRLLSWRSYPK